MVDSILLQRKSSNCREDEGFFLLNLKSICAEYQQATPIEDVPLRAFCQTGSSLFSLVFNIEMDDLSTEEENTLVYIAGYMARKLHKKACQQCRQSMTGSLTGSSTEVVLQKKQLEHAKEGLGIPSAQLVCAIEITERVFKTSGQLLHMDTVRSRFLLRLNKELESNALVCSTGECKMRDYAVGLFVNIRFHTVLRNNNHNFKPSRGGETGSC